MVFAWTVAVVWLIRNFVYSRYGRGVQAIREDEIASDLMSVDTRRVKILAFMLSSFCAGIAGALFAHLLQFISPRVFDIVKTTEVLIMVYLGGIASIGGSILGAASTRCCSNPAAVDCSVLAVMLPPGLFDPSTVRHQPLGILRMISCLCCSTGDDFGPGIMGKREFRMFIPRREGKHIGRNQVSGT